MPTLERVKNWVRRQPFYRGVRLRKLAELARRPTSYPDWSRAFAGHVPGPADDEGRPRVLIATNVGLHFTAVTVDSLLAAALPRHGADVEVLLCDGTLPACMFCDITWFPRPSRMATDGPGDLCPICVRGGEQTFAPLGVPLHRLSELITPEERADAARTATTVPLGEIPSLTLDSLPVGEQAMAGALRFFGRGEIASEPAGEAVLRRYLEAAILTAHASNRLFAGGRYDVVVVHHGIYVPQGLVSAAAEKAGARVVVWHTAYREGTLIFSHDDTYHRTMLTEPTATWETMPWTPERDAELESYLRSRWTGARDWISFQHEPDLDPTRIACELDIDPSRPMALLLTNVIWDACLHYGTNAFPNMQDWLVETVRQFAARPDLQLIVRVHPGEIRNALPAHQRAADVISEAFPVLPPNVRVIGPDHPASTYVLASQCDCALVYSTKAAVELLATGIPVIVAGEAWSRNKDLSLDATSPAEYAALLGRLPLRRRLEARTLERARRYAYHFFFRRMIPVNLLRPTHGWPLCILDVQHLKQLEPGACPGLDTICKGIIEGRDFVYLPES